MLKERSRLQLILRHPHASNRSIARLRNCSPTTIGKYRARIAILGLTAETLAAMTDAEVLLWLNGSPAAHHDKREPGWDWVLNLLQKGRSRRHVYDLFVTEMEGQSIISYRTLCERVGPLLDRKNPTMRIIHHAGDKMEVDFAGFCPRGHLAGAAVRFALFVAIMPCIGFGFACVVRDQKLPNWITAKLDFRQRAGLPFPGCCPAQAGLRQSRRRRHIPPQKQTTCREQHFRAISRPSRHGPHAGTARQAEGQALGRASGAGCSGAAGDRSGRQAVDDDGGNECPAAGSPGPHQCPSGTERAGGKPRAILPACRASGDEAVMRGGIQIFCRASVSEGATRLLSEVRKCLLFGSLRPDWPRRYPSCQMRYHRDILVASHARSWQAGEWVLNTDHMPQNHRAMRAKQEADLCLWAEDHGEAVRELAKIEADRGFSGAVRRNQYEILAGLARQWGGDTLDMACRRTREAEALNLNHVRNLLALGFHHVPLQPPPRRESANAGGENIRGAGYYQGRP